MLDENLKIAKFEFSQSCWDSIDDRYSLIKNGKNHKISYYNIYKLRNEMISEVINFEEFNKGILFIIKNWKRKYYPKYDICDGLCWELNLKLSNGKYVYYSGHHETPENYDDLPRFLEKYFNKT